ncbi:MAG: hypothetical protein COV59_04680 [Candidatus Magasanikbacteria bacterium CG11_big_fil_rev_8_21_14_0_20_39_34]|uniref:Uncharacterized protein n=1 Tax=Candidatus Magasanikbacteria bacterium CG11_big_fil_rev_8_21_14_0_20_39_34 TaxID=1974653 RepID=A0A2H0N4B5_9BACT|nr:MAG: hypothetical protein COV59_04680 [Candidatus Magasanikbacteria bacterium CG11_big_fil_rev_8_21_14_0_20_39_34]
MENIIYPQNIVWHLDLRQAEDPLEFFGKTTKKRIRQSVELLKDSSFKFLYEKVDETCLNKFLPIYRANIAQKENPKIIDIVGRVKEKIQEGNTVECCSFYDGEIFLGGVIYRYSEQDQDLKIHYRVFPKEISLKLPINISMIADYFIYKRALELKKVLLSHGQDRNAYGLHSAIGLAMFKLQAGCVPKVATKENMPIFSRDANDFLGQTVMFNNAHESPVQDETFVHDFTSTDGDVFIFLGKTPGEYIEEAVFYLRTPQEKAEEKYSILLNNPHFHTIVIHLDI